MSKFKSYLLLYGIFFLYSLGTVCSKIASGYDFLSFLFCLFYGVTIVILFVYAILWKQILKYLPLTEAYSNKAILVILGMLWGGVFFREPIKWNMILGAAVVVLGILFISKENKKEGGHE